MVPGTLLCTIDSLIYTRPTYSTKTILILQKKKLLPPAIPSHSTLLLYTYQRPVWALIMILHPGDSTGVIHV